MPCPGLSVEITEEALDKLVRNYCRESGVRSLEKHIEKIARKIAFNTVESLETIAGESVVTPSVSTANKVVVEVVEPSERMNMAIFNETHSDGIIEVGLEETIDTNIEQNNDTNIDANTQHNTDKNLHKINDGSELNPKTIIPETKKVIVTPENLEVYVGKARFSQDTIYDSAGTSLPPGVVMGLAWNPLVRLKYCNALLLYYCIMPSSPVILLWILCETEFLYN